MQYKLIGMAGLLAFIGFCFLLSRDRKAIKWKPVAGGIGLQVVFAVFILKTDMGQSIFEGARAFFDALFSFSIEGAKFVFGPLVKMDVTSQAFGAQNAFIFAFQIAATIIFVSALMAVLYHIGLMQIIVRGFAWIMQRIMGTSGAESLSSAANVFMGQTEAPLVVRPYLEKMTKSEIM